MVTAFVSKLRAGKRQAQLADSVGGSTFTFDLWDGHPMQDEVLGHLARMRTLGLELQARLQAYNDAHREVAASPLRVISYVGQTVIDSDEPA
jgi:hypothetical protein